MNALPYLTVGPWLLEYQCALTVRAALDHLESLRRTLPLIHLYADLFPTAWAASTAALIVAPDRLWSVAEWELLTRINTALFPLDLVALDGIDCRPETIPILPLTLGWHNQPTERRRPGWQLLWLLAAEATLPATTLTDPTVLQRLEQIVSPDYSHSLPAGVWETACRHAGGMTARIPRAFDLIYSITGNPWLDREDEGDYTAGWNRADITTLHAAYQAAQAELATLTELMDWLEASPTHMLEVLDLWHQTQNPIYARSPTPPTGP